MNGKLVDSRRLRSLVAAVPKPGPVFYWMSRDQRVDDNWALLYAQQRAKEQHEPLVVVFCLAPEFLGATIRQYNFMLAGLREVERKLNKYGIPFFMVSGSPKEELVSFLKRQNAGRLVTDFSPLRSNREWKHDVAARLSIPFEEVDAHNILPCWQASGKREYAAYTFRPKVRRLLGEFLTEFPPVARQKTSWRGEPMRIDWRRLTRSLRVNTEVDEVTWIRPGETAARKALDTFLSRRIVGYWANRNDPVKHSQSNLSPYLHFGQLSAQRVALETQRQDQDLKSQEAFLEELIVRRELSDNFCFYEPDYDSVAAFPKWARATLDEHLGDPREHLYGREELELGATHDDLWNAAQLEMVHRGKMHGYMRMYWAKKILEWSSDYATAFATAIYLNDKYELDGRDPNGYAGVAWSIGGLHDRPWFEREIFGKIRYMSYSGCKRKFDVAAYVRMIKAVIEESQR